MSAARNSRRRKRRKKTNQSRMDDADAGLQRSRGDTVNPSTGFVRLNSLERRDNNKVAKIPHRYVIEIYSKHSGEKMIEREREREDGGAKLSCVFPKYNYMDVPIQSLAPAHIICVSSLISSLLSLVSSVYQHLVLVYILYTPVLISRGVS